MRDTGGVLVAFAGVVLLIAAVRGTLGNVWSALTGGSGGGTSSQPPAAPQQNYTLVMGTDGLWHVVPVVPGQSGGYVPPILAPPQVPTGGNG